MNRQVVSEQLYDQTPAGVLVPSGSSTAISYSTTTSVNTAKHDGLELLNLFRKHGLNPNRSPSLLALISGATRLSDALLTAQDDEQSYPDIFSALQLSRILDAVAGVTKDDALPRVLGELLEGNISLLERRRSKAKDTLWELELLRILRANGVHAVLGEPDILLAGSTGDIGVACKKLYSDANFAKVLSVAIDQIHRSEKQGLVAVNIDDLLPNNAILQADNQPTASKIINDCLSDFMAAQDRHLRRYLQPGRTVAIVVSCAALADLKDSEPQFWNFRQTVAWHIPWVSQENDAEFKAILSAFDRPLA